MHQSKEKTYSCLMANSSHHIQADLANELEQHSRAGSFNLTIQLWVRRRTIVQGRFSQWFDAQLKFVLFCPNLGQSADPVQNQVIRSVGGKTHIVVKIPWTGNMGQNLREYH